MRNLFLATLTILAIAFTGCKKEETTTPATDFRDKIVGTYNVTSVLISKVVGIAPKPNRDTTVTQHNTLVITKDEVKADGLILTETEVGKMPFAFKIIATENSDKTGFNLTIPFYINDATGTVMQTYKRYNYLVSINGIEILKGSNNHGSGNYAQKTISYYYYTGAGILEYPDYFNNSSTAVKQ